MEVMVGSAIAMFVFTSFMLGLIAIDLNTMISKSKVQALYTIKGAIETLHGMQFDVIADSQTNAAYDAGPDNAFGTADDEMGVLTVTVADVADFDGDTLTNETAIDVDGDGINDCVDVGCLEPYAKPVNVSFQWSIAIWGVDRNFNLSLNTLISR